MRKKGGARSGIIRLVRRGGKKKGEGKEGMTTERHCQELGGKMKENKKKRNAHAEDF